MSKLTHSCRWLNIGSIVTVMCCLSACATTGTAVYGYNVAQTKNDQYVISIAADSPDGAITTMQQMADELVQAHHCVSFTTKTLEAGSQIVPVNKSPPPAAFFGDPLMRGFVQGEAMQPQAIQVYGLKSQVNLIGCQNK